MKIKLTQYKIYCTVIADSLLLWQWQYGSKLNYLGYRLDRELTDKVYRRQLSGYKAWARHPGDYGLSPEVILRNCIIEENYFWKHINITRSPKLNFKKDCNIYNAHKALNNKLLKDQIKF